MRRVMSWLMVLLMACPVQATQWLKQSTAVTVKIGPFVDSTDGITPETGLTISQADIRLSKNGGDFAQTHNAAGSTHDENGWHDVPLDTTDTGTLGTLDLAIYESGAAPVFRNYMVVTANVWDSMFGADYLQVDRIQVGGTANATATIANAFGGSTFQAASDVKTTMEASGSSLANILEDTGTTLPATLTTIAGYTDGIETKTNNLPASPAAVGSAMNLADDAITAAKFDESTAFPLKSADTGSTAVARTGADSDTLETLSDQIDGVGSAADPWALTASGYSAGTFGYIVMNTASMDDVNDAMASDGVVAALQAGLATAVYVADMNDAIRGDIAGIEAGSGLTAQETRDAMKLAPSAGAAASGSIDAVIADILTDTGTTLDGRIPAALVSGRMDASVGAMANNVLTSSAINADAITAAKMAADVTTELQTGLATAAQATAIETDTQDLQAQIGTDGAGLTAIGDTRIANLDAAVSSRATAAELAKVPKSDGTASWNATALSAINAEVDTALNTAIPGSPTADSINERIVAIDAYGAPPTAAAIKTAIEADGSKIDHLWEMTEDDGGTRRYTVNALEQAPTGTGSGLTPQQTRDAMKLAPSPGAAADGSIDNWFSDLEALIDQIISVLGVVTPQ